MKDMNQFPHSRSICKCLDAWVQHYAPNLNLGHWSVVPIYPTAPYHAAMLTFKNHPSNDEHRRFTSERPIVAHEMFDLILEPHPDAKPDDVKVLRQVVEQHGFTYNVPMVWRLSDKGKEVLRSHITQMSLGYVQWQIREKQNAIHHPAHQEWPEPI